MNTTLTLAGSDFHINGKPTYAGRDWQGVRIEGLLLNSRMVQGIFDDLNPATRSRFDYPDGPWNADRNTSDFVAAMPSWRARGLLSFTLNLQGGNPEGYGPDQPWHNSAYEADGTLRPEYMLRLERILTRADELGMAPIVGLFYFGQDQRLADEQAVIAATRNACDWLVARGYNNLIIEINNECDVPRYDHAILKPARVHELIQLARERTAGRYPVGTSMGGGSIPPDNILAASDVALLHGNGVGECGGPGDPARIASMVAQVRKHPDFRGPIVFNEDDHYGFDRDDNNMLAAIRAGASWGLFDWRFEGEGFDDGYQCLPCNWAISSPRKRAFFELVKQVTGA